MSARDYQEISSSVLGGAKTLLYAAFQRKTGSHLIDAGIVPWQ